MQHRHSFRSACAALCAALGLAACGGPGQDLVARGEGYESGKDDAARCHSYTLSVRGFTDPYVAVGGCVQKAEGSWWQCSAPGTGTPWVPYAGDPAGCAPRFPYDGSLPPAPAEPRCHSATLQSRGVADPYVVFGGCVQTSGGGWWQCTAPGTSSPWTELAGDPASCAVSHAYPEQPTPGDRAALPCWNAEHDGGKHVVVDLSAQTAAAYEGGALKATFTIASGLPTWDTFTTRGRYCVFSRVRAQWMSGPGYHVYTEWVQYFTASGIAFHDADRWLSPEDYGRPQSHGCVNMTAADAQWLWSWATDDERAMDAPLRVEVIGCTPNGDGTVFPQPGCA